MTRWEYKVVTYRVDEFRKKQPDYQQLEADLNELGAAGWEFFEAVAPGRGQGQASELVLIGRRPAAD